MDSRRLLKAGGARVVVALALTAAGCSPELPTGQVLATVDGVAITRRDLATELRATGLGVNADPATRQAVLAKLVERVLLVRAARSERIDRSPDYLAALRRTRDLLQLSLLTQRLQDEQAVPDTGDIATFIATRSWMFAQRELVTADLLSLPSGVGGGVLSGQPSLDTAARRLAAQRIPFRRRVVRLDSGTLDADSARRLLAAGGDPVVLRIEDRPALAVALARQPAPIDPVRAPGLARAIIMRRDQAAGLARLVAKQRRHATISYQQGYGPGAQ